MLKRFGLEFKNLFPIGFRFLGAFLAFLLILLVNSVLGVDVYGKLVYHQIFAGFVATLAMLGLNKLIISSYHSVRQELKNELIGKHLKILALHLIVILALMLLLKSTLTGFGFSPLIIPIVLIRTIRLYINEIGRAQKFYGLYAFQSFMAESLLLILLILIQFTDSIIINLLVAELVMMILVVAELIWIVLKNGHFNKLLAAGLNSREYQSEIKRSFSFFAMSISIYLIAWSDQFILKSFLDFEVLGKYSSLIRLGQIAVMPLTALKVIWYNDISIAFQQRSKSLLQMVKKQQIISVFATAIMVFLVYMFKGILIDLMHIGSIDEWLLILVLIGFLVEGIYGPAMGVLTYSGHEKFVARILALLIPLSITINLILIYKMGALGAAVSLILIRFIQNHIFFVKGRNVLSSNN